MDRLTQADIPATDTLCDFCNVSLEGEVAWAWPVATFIVHELAYRCWGDWDACVQCHRLLQANEFRLLFQRVVKLFMMEGDMSGEADLRARFTLKLFKLHRLAGPPHRITGQRQTD